MRIEDDKINAKSQLNKEKAVFFNGDFEIQDKKDSLLRYIINGVLMFYVSYGCIETFASAFSIKHFNTILFFVMILLAVLYSFMHISENTHKIGYCCILFCYVYMILKMKTIIKSGFATIINETLLVIQEKLDLARIKQYTEYVDNKELAVTMCLIVIGFVMLLILNILISEYLNIIATIIITAPMVISGYYFEQKPNIIPIIMYVAGIIGILIMRLNNKCTLYSSENSYYVDNEEDFEKKYVYIVANRMHGHLLLIVVVCVTMLSGVFSLVLKNNYKNSLFVKTFVKDFMDERVTDIVTDTGNGGSKKAASGGLSKGKLGNVSNIQYDNKTDLKVKFVPQDDSDVYLRGYIGSVYEDNSWKMLSRADNEKYNHMSKELEDLYDITPQERVGYSYKLLENVSTSIFTVENVDANGEYAFLPYYAELNNKCMKAKNDDEIFMTVNALSYEIRFRQNTSFVNEKIDDRKLFEDFLIEANVQKHYKTMKKIYTVVPKANKEVMKSVVKEIGLIKKSSYTNSEINIIIDKIQEYYRKSYVYTLAPGETPEEEDYINYFIKTKKGFCAHYASAAVMIMRYMGLPARYVEGYMVSNELIKKGKKITGSDVEKYTMDYDQGEKYLVEVEVPDNKAHAWIEVYKENFGWVPYEMTVYKRREEKINNVGYGTKIELQKLKTNIIESGKKTVVVLIIMCGIVIISLFIVIIRFCINKGKRSRKLNSKDKSLAIEYTYLYLCDVLKFIGIKREKGMTIDEYFLKVQNKGIAGADVLNSIASYIKKAAYSNEKIVKEDYEYVKTQVENIVKIQYNELGLKDKIKFKLFYNL